MNFLHNCTYHFGNRFGCITEPIVEEEENFGFYYPPLYYRFNRHIPRRRLWRWW